MVDNEITENSTISKPKAGLKNLWPDMWMLFKPRLAILIGCFVLMVINRASGLVLPAISAPFIDRVLSPTPHTGHIELLLYIVGAVLAATVLQGGTSYVLTQLLAKSGQRLIADLRMEVQSHIGRLPVSFYDKNPTGSLVSRIMNDVEVVRNFVGSGVLDFLSGLLTAVIAFLYLLHLNTEMTLWMFGILLIFMVVMQQTLKKLGPIFLERAKINAEVIGRLTESLGGVRVVKAYHAEAREAKVFAAGAERLLQNAIGSLTAQSLMGLAFTTVLGIAGALVMYLGAHQNYAGRLTTGEYFSFALFLTFMIAPMGQLVSIGTQLTEAVAGLDRTKEILEEEEEGSEPMRAQEAGYVQGHVALQEVFFEYEAGKPVLHGISFESKPGTVTALVGPSGSGKSTIISLLCGFHTATSGTILIDGRDLSTLRLSSYRQQLGVVLQEAFLFDGTIRENVMFSRPKASEEQFMNACEIARVDEFARRFPEGFETIVGERGVRLSGGQKQRISIARAILADPRILVLDEATSSLDSESEAMIQDGLTYLMEGRTTFVIAHRLSTIRRADRILMIEQGQLLESGTHEELYKLGGRYFDLYTQQRGVETNLFLAPGDEDMAPKATM